MEKEELIVLVREYIDVFAWNYEDMPGFDPQVAMHRLNIKPDAKPVKQQQRRFRPNIMEAIEDEVHKLIVCSFIREESIQIGLLILFLFLRRIKKFGSVLITVTSIQPVLKTNSHCCPSLMSWLIIPADSKECPSWTTFQGISKLRISRGWETYFVPNTVGVYCYTVMPFGLKNVGATY